MVTPEGLEIKIVARLLNSAPRAFGILMLFLFETLLVGVTSLKDGYQTLFLVVSMLSQHKESSKDDFR